MGSGESVLDFEQALFYSIRENIQVKIWHGENGLVEMSVTQNNQSVKVDPVYLFDAKDVDISSVKLIVGPLAPKAFAPGEVTKNGFIVSFEYGGDSAHGSKENSVLVRSVIRIHFSENTVNHSEMAMPLGGNTWQLFLKAPDKNVKENGIEKSVKCPWTTSQ